MSPEHVDREKLMCIGIDLETYRNAYNSISNKNFIPIKVVKIAMECAANMFSWIFVDTVHVSMSKAEKICKNFIAEKITIIFVKPKCFTIARCHIFFFW